MLFDGASLVLYMCGIVVYFANIIKGLRIVSSGDYGAAAVASGEEQPEQVLGREDSLKVLAASNTILALVLVGVLVLQAGQWYAERSQQQEADDLNKKDQERRESAAGSPKVAKQASAASKKKQ